MAQRIDRIGDLHTDLKNLMDTVVNNIGSDIVSGLSKSLSNLHGNWQGADAGKNLKDLANVYNDMVNLRNVLGNLCVEGSKIAVGYRQMHINHGVTSREELPILNFESSSNDKADYSDDRDMIDFNDATAAAQAKDLILNASEKFPSFLEKCKIYMNQVTTNWTAGASVETAVEAFEQFESKANQHKANLDIVAQNLESAINDYLNQEK